MLGVLLYEYLFLFFYGLGKVRLAFDKNTGLQVAVKIVRKDLLDDDEMSVKLLREIAVMKVMDHTNVLHLYDYYEDLEHMYVSFHLPISLVNFYV